MRATLKQAFFLLIGSALVTACSDDDPMSPSGELDARYYAGGETTVFSNTTQGFAVPAPNLQGGRLSKHLDGDLAFEQAFVSAPATVNSGLGPVYNNISCVSCHPSDGRGMPPFDGQEMESMLLRISVPGSHPDIPGAPKAVPGFGGQLADKALFGVEPEARPLLTWEHSTFTYPDGESVGLRKPHIEITQPYSPWPSDAMVSPRVAPPVFGRGLLEAISETTMREFADPNDADGDGISGKVNMVWDMATASYMPGRFGWKAEQPTLLQQTATAYQQDMGVSNPVHPYDNAIGQPQEDQLSDDPEITMQILEDATFYVQTLSVPARRNVEDPQVERGSALFSQIGCGSCHVSKVVTGTLADVPEVSQQTIYPYTDMLLHDMGDDLSDNRPSFDAMGNEWRTPPLWGLGLTQLVNGHEYLLHDGRARNIEEAILWHGGEGAASRDAFAELAKESREDVIAFLRSL